VDCIVFCREIKWQAEALELMQKILKAQESRQRPGTGYLFLTQELWHCFICTWIREADDEPYQSSTGKNTADDDNIFIKNSEQ